jgi:hypothetical protein
MQTLTTLRRKQAETLPLKFSPLRDDDKALKEQFKIANE